MNTSVSFDVILCINLCFTLSRGIGSGMGSEHNINGYKSNVQNGINPVNGHRNDRVNRLNGGYQPQDQNGRNLVVPNGHHESPVNEPKDMEIQQTNSHPNSHTNNHSNNSNKRKVNAPAPPETSQLSQQRPHRAVYASYCTPRDDGFVICCCALGYRLKMEGVRYPRLLLLPQNCFDSNGNVLSHFHLFYEFWDILRPFNHPEGRFRFYYAKIHAFSLTEYERVFFMEPYCITNDSQIESRFDGVDHVPSAPDNHRYGRHFEAMVLRPDEMIFNQMIAASYRIGPQIGMADIHKMIDISCRWTTIPKALDKDEWLLNVWRRDISRGNSTVTASSFVVAFFRDSNPWELYQQGFGQCEVVAVWMETASKLVKESKLIHTLVDPRILRVIMDYRPSNPMKPGNGRTVTKCANNTGSGGTCSFGANAVGAGSADSERLKAESQKVGDTAITDIVEEAVDTAVTVIDDSLGDDANVDIEADPENGKVHDGNDADYKSPKSPISPTLDVMESVDVMDSARRTVSAPEETMDSVRGSERTQNGDIDDGNGSNGNCNVLHNPYLDPLLMHQIKEFDPKKNEEFVSHHRSKWVTPPAPPSVSNSSMEDESQSIETVIETNPMGDAVQKSVVRQSAGDGMQETAVHKAAVQSPSTIQSTTEMNPPTDPPTNRMVNPPTNQMSITSPPPSQGTLSSSPSVDMNPRDPDEEDEKFEVGNDHKMLSLSASL